MRQAQLPLRRFLGGEENLLKPLRAKGSGPVAQALDFGATDAAAFVDVCYHAILGRAPDRAGLSSYAEMIARTPDRETLIAVLRSIAMSVEARDYREHYLASQR